MVESGGGSLSSTGLPPVVLCSITLVKVSSCCCHKLYPNSESTNKTERQGKPTNVLYANKQNYCPASLSVLLQFISSAGPVAGHVAISIVYSPS